MLNDAISSNTAVTAIGTSLSQGRRIGDLFLEPLKTFSDIRSGDRRWFAPILIVFLGFYMLFGMITYRVGWRIVAENTLKQRPTLQEQIRGMSNEEREQLFHTQSVVAEIAFACSPLIIFVTYIVISGVLMGTFALVWGKHATFPTVFAVVVFGMLPTVFQSLSASFSLLFDAPRENFFLNTMYPTSLAAFLPIDTNQILLSLASSVDIVSIWCMFLIGLGMSVVTGASRKQAIGTILVWWIVTNLLRNGAAVVLG